MKDTIVGLAGGNGGGIAPRDNPDPQDPATGAVVAALVGQPAPVAKHAPRAPAQGSNGAPRPPIAVAGAARPAQDAPTVPVKAELGAANEQGAFAASLLQQYHHAMVMQLQAQMALGGLGQPNQLLGNPASLGVIADPRQLLNVSNIHSPALHQQVPIREEKEISQLQKLPALSADPSPSFLSMDHRTLQRGKAEGQEHQRGFQSINENKSYAPLKGGVKKQSHAPDQGCSSMSMLDRSDLVGSDPATMNEENLKKLRRKESNRESARRSRLRKQAENKSLRGENELLKAEVQLLRKENSDLKDVVMKLQDRMNSVDPRIRHHVQATPEGVG